MKTIYLDNAATTAVDPAVVKEMLPFFSKKFGNPGSFHNVGLESKKAIDAARKSVSTILKCKTSEIIFTGGGTESVNLAIKGIALRNKNKGNHIITSKVEHPCVLETCSFLERNNFSVTYLNVDKHGLVSPDDIRSAITDKTILISIMYANNEIGTIQPIREIGRIAKEKNVLFHTDACQAAGFLKLTPSELNVDLLTINGSKIYGPKGAGVLYKKDSVILEPLLHGGGQEFGLRSGTENVPAIVGFAKALELAQKSREEETKRLTKLRDTLIKGLLKIPKSRLNGHPNLRLPNNVNITFLDVEGEAMLLHLNERGVCASTGSACASHSLEPSHVLKAIGLSYEGAHGSIRFTLGKDAKQKDIQYVIKIMPGIVEQLRKISPVNLSEEHVQNFQSKDKPPVLDHHQDLIKSKTCKS